MQQPADRPPRAARGFSLLELMITCAVVAILASIALPSYRQHVTKTHRVQAQICMTDQANVLERHYTRALRYTGAPLANCAADLKGYTLRVETPARGYRVLADPVAGRGDPRCGRMTLDQAGQTTAAGEGCW